MKKKTELEVLFPDDAGNSLEINGETIEVKTFKFGQLPRVLQTVKGVFGLIQDHIDKDTIESPEALIQILAHGGEDLIILMMIGINKDREWFDEVESDDGIQLLMKFIEVNMSFFIQRVLPIVNRSSEDLLKKAEEITTQK